MSEELNPVTREEMFLAKAAGQNTPDLKPITRVERFLQNLIDHVKSIGSGGGSGGGAFYVTITGDDNVGYTADKTVAEVMEAYEAGKPVYCIIEAETSDSEISDIILPIAVVLGGVVVFASVFENVHRMVIIGDENAMVMEERLATTEDKLVNPNSLVFDGAVTGSYDGSEYVKITIPTVPTVADILAALPTWNGGSY